MAKFVFSFDHAKQQIAGFVYRLAMRAAEMRAHLVVCDADRAATVTERLALCDRLVAELTAMAKAPVLPPIMDQWFAMRARIEAADEGVGYAETIDAELTDDDEDGVRADRHPYLGLWIYYHAQLGHDGYCPADAEAYLGDLMFIAENLMAERGVRDDDAAGPPIDEMPPKQPP